MPSKLDIARFDIEEEDSDVEGFVYVPYVTKGTISPQLAQGTEGLSKLNLGVGRIPGSILVPQ